MPLKEESRRGVTLVGSVKSRSRGQDLQPHDTRGPAISQRHREFVPVDVLQLLRALGCSSTEPIKFTTAEKEVAR
jgi:hypothetical protein